MLPAKALALPEARYPKRAIEGTVSELGIRLGKLQLLFYGLWSRNSCSRSACCLQQNIQPGSAQSHDDPQEPISHALMGQRARRRPMIRRGGAISSASSRRPRRCAYVRSDGRGSSRKRPGPIVPCQPETARSRSAPRPRPRPPRHARRASAHRTRRHVQNFVESNKNRSCSKKKTHTENRLKADVA